MIKLRLKRFGKKREASFRLVACNSTSRRDGRPLQELGFYNPRTKETRLDTEALRIRLGQGAQPTDAVRTLLEKGGLPGMEGGLPGMGGLPSMPSSGANPYQSRKGRGGPGSPPRRQRPIKKKKGFGDL